MSDWITVKLSQHAQDSSRTAVRSGFEGNEVSDLKSDLAKSFRAAAKGGGLVRRSSLFTRGDSRQSEVGKLRSGHLGTGAEQLTEAGSDPSTPSVDEEEEFAAAAEAAHDRGLCPTPGAISRHGQPGFSTQKASWPTTAGTEATREADSCIVSSLGDIQVDRMYRVVPSPSFLDPTRRGPLRARLMGELHGHAGLLDRRRTVTNPHPGSDCRVVLLCPSRDPQPGVVL